MNIWQKGARRFSIVSKTAFLLTPVVSLLAAGEVVAQNETDLVLEEIIVTAQKRSERLIDVPISIAAISAQAIEQMGIRELQEIDEYVPNLQISKGNSYATTITIRGVGSSSRNVGFDSRVGVYVDGVYMGQSPATNQDILDLERIEVLRGPQGSLFGKNTVAGAISLITKKPGEEFGGTVKVDVGNLGSRRVSLMTDVPIGDKLFAKLAVNKQERDGYVDNLPTGVELGEQDGFSYRLQLRSPLSENVEMNIVFDGLESERMNYTGAPVATRAA